MQVASQLLSPLVVISFCEDPGVLVPGSGPRVHRQSLVLFRRPATGVSGQESLSSSEDEESRFSPIRGEAVRNEVSVIERVEPDLWTVDCRDNGMLATSVLEDVLDSKIWCAADESDLGDARDAVEAIEDSVELEDARSECASVYLTVLISSSSGVRKDTRFSAGNMGRPDAILRGMMDFAGLFARMEVK